MTCAVHVFYIIDINLVTLLIVNFEQHMLNKLVADLLGRLVCDRQTVLVYFWKQILVGGIVAILLLWRVNIVHMHAAAT